ncbi:glutamine--scyllo-inositol aminotransferase [Clostridium folliculivorans]|uniref:Glutamine--scyllo-inositol aminotransferase n=1 Tax=Clostridium folliculivorans TaxID=2886038 RepID=A0A9W6DCE8_9CLOT|nr:DegT/DnrJ/EryC1/StrS family aminotransferase [Clostridium folliculivorans]GKU26926.1 glutamine--scyllo-inositol aminotransferase [Clostridium folliculivorans]
MEISLIDLKAQYNTISDQLNSVVLDVLASTNYIMGENVNKFEKEFSDYLGVKNAISVGNGTDALVIAMKALGIKEGDEVITTPFTFFSTAESISAIGAIPVFVDVNLDTFNIDVKKIEDKITKNTKAIMPVHIFGQPADMDEVLEIAKRYNLYVIEDACQAIGAKYKGEKVGVLGDVACFSFFPTKNLGCAGDGGMIVTNNDNIATLAKALRTHGSGENGQKAYNLINGTNEKLDVSNSGNDTVYNPLKYYNYLIGHNSRLDAMQAAILRVKLKEIDKWNDKRRDNARFYNENIKNESLVKPTEAEGRRHVYHMYILQSDHREVFLEYLKDKGIATGVYYPVPLHLQKVYIELGYKNGDFPNTEYLSKRTFAIPMYAELTLEQKHYIVDAINDFIGR